MRRALYLAGITFLFFHIATAQLSDPRLLEARKFWEQYDQWKVKTELEQAAQYRKLKEIYSLFKTEDLSAVDRLGKQAVTLRAAYLDMPQVSVPAYEEGIRRALADFHNVTRAAKNVAERVDNYPILAEQYGVNVASPTPAQSLIDDVIQTGVLTSARLPSVGRTYGSALSGILNDALPLYSTEDRACLKTALTDVVELDAKNMAGPSKLYLELQRLDKVLASPLATDPDNIDRLKEELSSSAKNWKDGVELFDTKCNSLVLVEQYADRMFNMSKKAPDEKVHQELLLRSLYAMKDTLAASYPSCSSSAGLAQLTTVRKLLLDRLLEWGWKQWTVAINTQDVEERAASLVSLTRLMKNFVDDSNEFLLKEQQHLVHAYLAQAFTLLGEDKKAMSHYEKAKYVLPVSQLEQIARHRSAMSRR